MKLKLLPLFILLITTTAFGQLRYIDEVFNEVAVIENQLYSANISVATGAPALDSLYCDIYMPVGDTSTSRPLAIVLHTGTFLPRGLFAPVGDKDDYANVQISRRLAQRGYVAASVQYRPGWNPLAATEEERRSGIINAAYRSIQDMYAFIRFMNMTVSDQGNPFGLDMDKVAIFGVGTGGFVGLNAAVIDIPQEEMYIDKFRDPVSGVPMIDTNLLGSITGETQGAINIPNHVGYSNDFHFAFGLDGGIGDSSWLETGEVTVPLVCAGTVTHPTTPFGINPETDMIDCDMPVFAGAGTGIFVVNISGSACMVEKANALGYNAKLNAYVYNDDVTTTLSEHEYAQDHLWAIHLPGPQSGPWEYWDSTFWKNVDHPLFPNMHEAGLATNPDMSMEKANNYIDTSLWFFAPRACVTMELGDCGDVTSGLSDLVESEYEFTIAPNPAYQEALISVDARENLSDIVVFDMFGRVVFTQRNVNQNQYRLDVSQFAPGMYGIRASIGDKGFLSGKIMVQH